MASNSSRMSGAQGKDGQESFLDTSLPPEVGEGLDDSQVYVDTVMQNQKVTEVDSQMDDPHSSTGSPSILQTRRKRNRSGSPDSPSKKAKSKSDK